MAKAPRITNHPTASTHSPTVVADMVLWSSAYTYPTPAQIAATTTNNPIAATMARTVWFVRNTLITG